MIKPLSLGLYYSCYSTELKGCVIDRFRRDFFVKNVLHLSLKQTIKVLTILQVKISNIKDTIQLEVIEFSTKCGVKRLLPADFKCARTHVKPS